MVRHAYHAKEIPQHNARGKDRTPDLRGQGGALALPNWANSYPYSSGLDEDVEHVFSNFVADCFPTLVSLIINK